MNITKREKWIEGPLTKFQECRESDSNSCCIHNDEQEKLFFIRKVKIENYFYSVEQEFLCCPYCGFSYQKEEEWKVKI